MLLGLWFNPKLIMMNHFEVYPDFNLVAQYGGDCLVETLGGGLNCRVEVLDLALQIKPVVERREIPEPASMILFASGLAALGAYTRRKRQ